MTAVIFAYSAVEFVTISSSSAYEDHLHLTMETPTTVHWADTAQGK